MQNVWNTRNMKESECKSAGTCINYKAKYGKNIDFLLYKAEC